jgi:hypothetical protein
MRTIGRWLSAIVDRADYVLTLTRLAVLDLACATAGHAC